MVYERKLYLLQKKLEAEYQNYKQGSISEKEYCSRAKPIDSAIGKLEIATLLGTPVLKESFLLHTLKLKH